MKCGVCKEELTVIEELFSAQDGNPICFECVKKRHAEVVGL